MQRSLEKLFMLLAASDFSDRELKSALRELHEYPSDVIVNFVAECRREMLCRVREHPMSPDMYRRSGSRSFRGESEPVRRVEQLLREEAHLTVSLAVEKLLRSLRLEERADVSDLKPPNRESFRNWLLKVLKRVEPSVLLHHATKIRNRHVHGQDTDWPLKE